jgi:nucleotide-binding universal stress UspA family protein
MKILLAVDGSKPSLKAVQMLIDRAGWYRSRPEVELVAVHRPLPTMRGVSKGQAEKYYAEECESMLAAARKKLDGAGIAYQARALVGPVAETIVRHAKDKRCDLIVIGTRGMGELKSALIGSIAIKVLHLSDTPVLLVK